MIQDFNTWCSALEFSAVSFVGHGLRAEPQIMFFCLSGAEVAKAVSTEYNIYS